MNNALNVIIYCGNCKKEINGKYICSSCYKVRYCNIECQKING